MNSEQLFQAALNLEEPWQVKHVSFNKNEAAEQELVIRVGYPIGSTFKDMQGQDCKVYDTEVRRWQHLNFFQHRCIIEATVPRITDSAGVVKTVQVPWSRAGSGFTLLFEAFAMALIESEMPVTRVAALLGVTDPRIWRVFGHWVGKALSTDRCDKLTELAIDETSSKRGHRYVTVGVDLADHRVVAVVEGKSMASVAAVADILAHKGAPAEQVAEISMDLSPAFVSGVSETFKNAKITFDRFHVVKLLNQAFGKVHQMERAEHVALKGTKFTFLKNRKSLSDKREAALTEMLTAYPAIGEAYRLKTVFNLLWDLKTEAQATAFIHAWCREVEALKITPFMAFANTLRSHLSGIVRFITTKISNGVLEGINSKIQLAKRRARGFRNIQNFINMIYFLCGKLKFDLPH